MPPLPPKRQIKARSTALLCREIVGILDAFAPLLAPPQVVLCNREMNTATAQNNRFSAAYRLLDEAIAQRAFPGCSFGVLAGNEIVLQDARGRFTYDES